jgi:hypothetical protein
MNNYTEWSGRNLSTDIPETFTWRYENIQNSSFAIVRYPFVTWNEILQDKVLQLHQYALS